MNPETITFLILGLATILLLSDRLRPDLIALLVVISLGITGVLTAQEAFSGFSRSAVITIIAIFILAEGLQRTGVTGQMGKVLLRMSGSREGWLAIIAMFAGAFLSLFMNNIAAASVLFPAVTGAAHKSGFSSSRLLMPLAFGTILGGMATLFTTNNIIVSSLLKDQGLTGFGVLDFAPLGLPLVAIGIAYMAIWGRRLLPAKSPSQRIDELSQEEADLSEVYKLNERLLQAKVPNDSALIGITLEESRLRESYNLNVVAIQRDSKVILSPAPDFRFAKGDLVILEGRPAEITQENIHPALILIERENWDGKGLESEEKVLVEVVLSPRSNLIGQTLRSSRFREKYDMNVLAIWRSGRPIRTHLPDETLHFGDALLLLGGRKRVTVLQSEPDLIVLNYERQEGVKIVRKSWLALLIMVVTLAVAALTPLPVGEVMLGGAIAMVLLGNLTMDHVYRAIDWKTVFLIAGMLPLGIAMQKTGAASTLGNGLVLLLGQATPLMYLGGLILIAILMSQVMNSATVATVITPIAIGIAQQMDIDPRAIAMGVAMGASLTFITPLGHPVNLFVMGPGGYQFKDFIKVGLPLTFLLYLALLILLPVIWPLR